MTAREMIEQECAGELQEKAHTHNYCVQRLVAAERVIERLDAALDEQTKRANHHEERATELSTEVERLRALLIRADCEVEAAMPHGATYPSCILCGGEIAHTDDCIITEIRKELHKEVRP